MSFHNGPKMITNNLVLYLDPANIKSYSGAGNSWKDLSIYQNHATLNNCSLTTSNNNKYFNLNYGSYIEINDSNSLQFTTSFTIFMWVYFLNEITDIYRTLIGKPDPVQDGYGIIAEWTGGNMLQADFIDVEDDARNGVVIYPSLTSWNFITQTYYYTTTGTNNHTIYCFSNNGNLSSSATFLSSTVATNNSSLFISEQSGSDLEFLLGPVGAYNRALSEKEVIQNYNAIKSRFGL